MFGLHAINTPRTLAGRYQLTEIAGKGGMGVVWSAWDDSVQRQVAVKLVLPAQTEEEHLQRLARLERERRVLIELSQHPNIVTLFDMLTDPIGYVMEWIEGFDMEVWLKLNPGPRDPEVVASIFGPILDAVGYAHECGVIHRDLKSSNVFLQSLGDRVSVRVMDFGLARIVQQQSNITTDRLIVGTPQYMAPEQILGNESTAETDIYALGVLLFECVTGALPVETNTESPIPMLVAKINQELPEARSVYPDCSPELEAVITRATRRAPSERYANCEEFAEALFAALPNVARRVRPSIDNSLLGVIPPTPERTSAPSITRAGSALDPASPLYDAAATAATLRSQPLRGRTSSARTPEQSFTSDVTAVGPSPFVSGSSRETRATHPRPSPSDGAPFVIIGRAVRRAVLQIRALPYAPPRTQLLVGAALLCAIVLLALLPLLGRTPPPEPPVAMIGDPLEKLVPIEFDLFLGTLPVRGAQATAPNVKAALRDYRRSIQSWNDGNRSAVLAAHRTPMRCYYNSKDFPVASLPLQPLVRTSLGLPNPPFVPKDIYVTAAGRDYVTFVEEGASGVDGKTPYVRLVQMAGGRKSRWRVSVEVSLTAHDCYENFDTHYQRWADAQKAP